MPTGGVAASCCCPLERKEEEGPKLWKWEDVDTSPTAGQKEPLGGRIGGGAAEGEPGLVMSPWRKAKVVGERRASKEPLRLSCAAAFRDARAALCIIAGVFDTGRHCLYCNLA